jgi:hypothetical protein
MTRRRSYDDQGLTARLGPSRLSDGSNRLGKFGENWFSTVIMEPMNDGDSFFDPTFLDGKLPTLDSYVELVGAPKRYYFFAQVKTTLKGYGTGSKAKRLGVEVSRTDLDRLESFPAPTYIFAINQHDKAVYVLSANEHLSRLADFPTKFPLTRTNMQRLWDEVSTFWDARDMILMPKNIEEPWYAEKRAMAYVSSLFALQEIARLEEPRDDLGVDLVIDVPEGGEHGIRRSLAIQVSGFRELPSHAELSRRISKDFLARHLSQFQLPLVTCAVSFATLKASYCWMLEPVVERGRASLRRPVGYDWQSFDENAAREITSAVTAFYDVLLDLQIK